MAIRRIVVSNRTLALVPFTDISSFSRTYENFAQYARRNGYKEFKSTNEGERIAFLLVLHYMIPSLRYIAFGQTLPAEWDDPAENFLLATFHKSGQSQLELISVDMTLCEDEYITAACAFCT